MKFTVDRRTWLRGEGTEKSRLYRSADAKQCCLGFMCEALGVSTTEMAPSRTPMDLGFEPDVARPYSLDELLRQDDRLRRARPNDGSGAVSSPFYRAMYFNDLATMQDGMREWAIQQALAPLGLEVEFVN